jgi:transcriptional regulator GlxA family with amidase domain
MTKKVAVLAVNPVNGYGLFNYLESFYENKISYKVFAVANSTSISTNSGIKIEADDTIHNLIGHADEYDALVFSCGDAIPVFKQHASESYNVDMFSVIKEFGDKNKLMIGHCAAAMMFEKAGIANGKKFAIHPYAKAALKKNTANDDTIVVDGNFYTSQDEHYVSQLMPEILKALK